MRPTLTLPLFAGFCLLLAGCGDSHQQVTQESLNLLEKMATTVENIETVEDAESARPELDRIAEELKVLRMRARNLGAPDPAVDEQLKSKFGEEQAAISSRIREAFAKLDPESRSVLSGALVLPPK